MIDVRGEVLVIEGLSGAGKTTAAQNLARYYGYQNLNTGMLFRAAALGIQSENVGGVEAAICVSEMQFAIDLADPNEPGIAVNGKDVTELIQLPATTRLSTKLSNDPLIASRLEMVFDSYLEGSRMVVEGKNLKDRVVAAPSHHFFLLAEPAVRAYRKWNQAVIAGDTSYTLAQAQGDIYSNDHRDCHLFTVEPGVRVIDTSRLAPLQVVSLMVRHAASTVA